MKTLDDIIDNTSDPRELKRAISVKMLQTGMSVKTIVSLLNVSEQFVSKWKIRHEQEGLSSLQVVYQGKAPYLNADQQQAVVVWIQAQAAITIEALRDYIEKEYGVIYRSKQSYYDLLSAGGLSYHRSIAANPKRDEEQIMHKRAEIKKKWRNIKMR